MLKNINLNELLLIIAFVIFCDALIVFIIPSMMVYMMHQNGASQEAILNAYNSLSRTGEVFIVIAVSYAFFTLRKRRQKSASDFFKEIL